MLVFALKKLWYHGVKLASYHSVTHWHSWWGREDDDYGSGGVNVGMIIIEMKAPHFVP